MVLVSAHSAALWWAAWGFEEGAMVRLITVEREYGSGGAEFAHQLAKRLQWKFIDQCMIEASDRQSGELAHALFRSRDVYPIMRDFHVVAPTGWYGRPELSTAERAEVIAETVADTVVRRAAEVWQALAASSGAANEASTVNASEQVTA